MAEWIGYRNGILEKTRKSRKLLAENTGYWKDNEAELVTRKKNSKVV